MSPPILRQCPDNSQPMAGLARYRSDEAVARYCDAHYGPDKFGVPNFPARVAQVCADELSGTPRRRALDLGCSVGRASFELATRFDHVTGVDFSTPAIEIARRLQERCSVAYRLPEEGELISDHRVSLAGLDLSDTASNVSFQQGNVLQLHRRFKDYDLVLAANLIDRLPNPGKFLAGVHRFVAVGGLLAITSPYIWMKHFTPPATLARRLLSRRGPQDISGRVGPEARRTFRCAAGTQGFGVRHSRECTPVSALHFAADTLAPRPLTWRTAGLHPQH